MTSVTSVDDVDSAGDKIPKAYNGNFHQNATSILCSVCSGLDLRGDKFIIEESFNKLLSNNTIIEESVTNTVPEREDARPPYYYHRNDQGIRDRRHYLGDVVIKERSPRRDREKSSFQYYPEAREIPPYLPDRVMRETETSPRTQTRKVDQARSHVNVSKFTPKSQNKRFSLGRLCEIAQKADTCAVCALVWEGSKWGKESSDEVQCYANWEMDGRTVFEKHGSLASRMEALTRRIHIRWQGDSSVIKPKDFYLVFVAPRSSNLNTDAEDIWDKRDLFLGRDVVPNRDNGILIRSWLANCQEKHGVQCSRDTEDPVFSKMVSESYFGVVDVLDMCLTSLPLLDNVHDTSSASSASSYQPYLALSYVWGDEKGKYMTNLSNILLHRQQGGLEKVFRLLSPVIRDAIELVRRLGQRYIWIDALCIVQDSNRSWKLNTSVMNAIYGNAIITICAADGRDATTGLKATPLSDRTKRQVMKKCAPGVTLMVSHLVETSINDSIWNTRAWTFQERLISQRCLIFTDRGVCFQCPSTSMSEDIIAEPDGAGWSLEHVQAPPQMLRELGPRAFWVYMKCVQMYSSRVLSKPKDILAAFSGVSNLIEKSMGAPFIFGLPSSHFDLALLWEPQHSIQRREPRNSQETEDYGGFVFPSWSWCGWIGATMEYNTSMIEGCVTNVREWLLQHTWISWYIRDGRGNLRPLWDSRETYEVDSGEDNPVEQRWKGYMTSPRGCDEDPPLVVRPRRREPDRYAPRREDFRTRNVERERNFERNSSSESTSRDDRSDEGTLEHARRGLRHFRAKNYQDRYNDSDINVNDRGYRLNVDNYGRECRSSTDNYGRVLPPYIRDRRSTTFDLTLPENPYRVIMEPFNPNPDSEFPDQPILQFWTWYASFYITKAEDSPAPGKDLLRYDICDEIGDWCGSIVLDEQLASKDEINGTTQEFIAISAAKSFTAAECGVWTYYIPKEREQSEWDLYYVLLIKRDPKRGGMWTRVGLGKIFQTAFRSGVTRQVWKEIILG